MQTKLTQIQGNIKFMAIREAKGEPFRSTEEVWEAMKMEAQIDRECVWILHLNSQNRILDKELVSMGTDNHSALRAREVFRGALIRGSSAIIIVHNHPSDTAEPSTADEKCSCRLLEAANILGLPILDFVVIAKSGYTSFLEKKIGGFK
jgi:DNA repair protein RadC